VVLCVVLVVFFGVVVGWGVVGVVVCVFVC
jgi:hypothetical protein